MLCAKPFRPPGQMEFGCGQCAVCRINKSRLWQGRLLLESLTHKSSLFVTLTYSDEHEPENGFLSPGDLHAFLKKLRKKISFRYYAAGEYGEKFMRPHYHLVLFGDFKLQVKNGHYHVDVIAQCWKKGFIHIGELTHRSAAYITKYTLKNRWSKYDLDLAGLTPEFQRMSLKPGIGAPAMKQIAEDLMSGKGSALLAKLGDVPGSFKDEGKHYPFARYLQRFLRDQIGRDVQMPQAKILQLSSKKMLMDPMQRSKVREHHTIVAERRLNQAKRGKKL